MRGDADASPCPRWSRARSGTFVRDLRRRPGDAPLPGRARDRARRRASRSSTSSRSAARCSSRFGDDVHVLGGRLADAMRVEVPGVSAPPPADRRRRAARRRRPRAAADQRAAPGALQGPRSAAALALLGPAFVAAVAYIDPGNFATNIAGGAKYGYLLVWVIIAANLMAMLVQYLSAKVGVATGRNLPELCRDALPAPGHLGPVGPGGDHRHRDRPRRVRRRRDRAQPAVRRPAVHRRPDDRRRRVRRSSRCRRAATARFELAIAGLLGIVLLGFLYDLLQVGVDGPRVRSAGLVPHFDGTESILIAVGILGATVMPHVVYLHSALTQSRIKAEDDDERRELHALPARRRADRHGPRGRDQPDDAGRRRPALPRHRAHRRRLDRGRPRRASTRCSAAAPRSPSRSRCWPPGLSSSSVGTLRRPGRDAGLHQLPHPALPAPRDHHGARADRARRSASTRPTRSCSRRSCSALRHPVRARADDPADPPRGPHGRARQPPRSRPSIASHRRGDDHRAERRSCSTRRSRELTRVRSVGEHPAVDAREDEGTRGASGRRRAPARQRRAAPRRRARPAAAPRRTTSPRARRSARAAGSPRASRG